MVNEQVLTVSLEEFGLSKYESQAYVDFQKMQDLFGLPSIYFVDQKKYIKMFC